MCSSERSESNNNKCTYYSSRQRRSRRGRGRASQSSSPSSSSSSSSSYLYLLYILKILSIRSSSSSSSPSSPPSYMYTYMADAFTIMSNSHTNKRFTTPSSAATLLRNHNHFLNSLSSSSSSSKGVGVGASLSLSPSLPSSKVSASSLSSSKGASSTSPLHMSTAVVDEVDLDLELDLDVEELLLQTKSTTPPTTKTAAAAAAASSASSTTTKRKRKRRTTASTSTSRSGSRSRNRSGTNSEASDTHTQRKRRRILKLKPKKKRGGPIDIVQVMPIQIQKNVGGRNLNHEHDYEHDNKHDNKHDNDNTIETHDAHETNNKNDNDDSTVENRNKSNTNMNMNMNMNTNTQPGKIKMKKRRRKSSSSPSQSTSTIRVANLLTKEEEISLTSSIKSLRSVIRIRDELSLSKTMNNPGSSLDSYLPNPMYKKVDAYNNNYKMPLYKIQPTEQEWARACNNISIVQLRRIMVKGREARKRLVDANVGLVTQVAKKYSMALQKTYRDNGGFDNIGTILTLSDLIQEGNLGLMEAAERFDGERGFRFSTYAVHWVRSRILRCIADNSRVIRLPAHVHTTLRTIRKTKSEMEQAIGREPSMPELAHQLQMPISKLKLYTDSSLPVLSLEVPLNNGKSSKSGSGGDVDKRTLMDRIASDSPTPEEDAEFESLRRDIRTAIDSLGNDEERDVLLNRFGLEDGNPRTLGETAHRMGISREKVRRIEARALNKLRHPQRNYMLKEYVENACNDSRFGTGDGLVERREELMMNDRSPASNSKDRMTHFGDDTLNRFTPEMIWSV